MKYLIWLQSALGVANRHCVAALEYFGSAKEIFCADTETRAKSGVFTTRELSRLEKTSIIEANKILDDCNKANIKIIPYGSEQYPNCLSVIDTPPLLLYVLGEFPDFDNIPSICIVGPRKVSEFGKKSAFSLSFRLAAAGFIVVSGGAIGTDTYAHAGAIKADGVTVLCMGCGLLSDYLPENKKLRESVAKNGCLISEFPPHYKASKFTFPIRNRIMSALCLGTVLVEAPQRSGALITARHAYEQGRDVFVIPGLPNQKQYIGSNALLRDGAKPVLDISDIFNEYILRFPDKINVENAFNKPVIARKKVEVIEDSQENIKNFPQTLSNKAKIVYNYLDKQKFFPEEINAEGIHPQELPSLLTELEMEFLIKAIPGGMYEKL